MLKYGSLGVTIFLSSFLLFPPESEAIPLEPILDQLGRGLIERLLGVNTNSFYPYPISAGDSSGSSNYPSSSGTLPPEQNSTSYPNYQPTPYNPQSNPYQNYQPTPYYPPSNPYPYPPSQGYPPYPQPPVNYSPPTSQPFIYNPVYMTPPTINNFNNR